MERDISVTIKKPIIRLAFDSEPNGANAVHLDRKDGTSIDAFPITLKEKEQIQFLKEHLPDGSFIEFRDLLLNMSFISGFTDLSTPSHTNL